MAFGVRIINILSDPQTYVTGHAGSIINYAAARQSAKPISTATTESTVQRLIHRRMTAKQQMRWSPRGAHLMLKVRTSVMNETGEKGCAQSDDGAVHQAIEEGGSALPQAGIARKARPKEDCRWPYEDVARQFER